MKLPQCLFIVSYVVGIDSVVKRHHSQGQSRVIGDMIVRIWDPPFDWLNDFDPITGNDAA